ALDDSLEISDRRRLEDAADQLVHDDSIAFLALSWGRPNPLQPVDPKLFGVDLAVDQPLSAGQANLAIAPRAGFGSNLFGDVQPGQRRARQNVGQGLVK